MKRNNSKNILIGVLFALSGLMTSCDTLDIKNLDSYDESVVWNDVNLATAYVNNLYAENFDGWRTNADANSDILTGMP